MSAVKRGNIWWARFQIKGHEFYESMGEGATKADAIAYEAKIRAEVLSGKLGLTGRHTITDAVDKWIYGQARVLADHKGEEARSLHLAKFIINRPLTDIVAAAADARDAFIAQGLAKSTINRRLQILRRSAKLAYREWGWLQEDLGMKIPMLKGETARCTFLTPAEVDRLVANCRHPVVSSTIKAMVRTGLREGEMLRVREVREGCIYVPGDIVKNRKSRLVPMPGDMPDFTIPIGITYNTLRHYFEDARKASDLSHVTIHDLRHTAASWWAQSGASLVMIRDLLGHTSFSQTTRYSHLLTSDMKKAADNMLKFINKGSE